jgi:hypothetical protein
VKKVRYANTKTRGFLLLRSPGFLTDILADFLRISWRDYSDLFHIIPNFLNTFKRAFIFYHCCHALKKYLRIYLLSCFHMCDWLLLPTICQYRLSTWQWDGHTSILSFRFFMNCSEKQPSSWFCLDLDWHSLCE